MRILAMPAKTAEAAFSVPLLLLQRLRRQRSVCLSCGSRPWMGEAKWRCGATAPGVTGSCSADRRGRCSSSTQGSNRRRTRQASPLRRLVLSDYCQVMRLAIAALDFHCAPADGFGLGYTAFAAELHTSRRTRQVSCKGALVAFNGKVILATSKWSGGDRFVIVYYNRALQKSRKRAESVKLVESAAHALGN